MRDKHNHDLFEWLKEGYSSGFISEIYCQNHEAYAMEDADKFSNLSEEADGPDFCWSVVRLKWSDEVERETMGDKKTVEEFLEEEAEKNNTLLGYYKEMFSLIEDAMRPVKDD